MSVAVLPNWAQILLWSDFSVFVYFVTLEQLRLKLILQLTVYLLFISQINKKIATFDFFLVFCGSVLFFLCILKKM